MPKADIHSTFLLGAIVGAAGGLAEVAWVALYSAATGGDAEIIAKGVTTAAGVSTLFPNALIGVGVAIHMALSLALGIALAFGWRSATKRCAPIGPYGFCIAVLLVVWVVNFFVILPLASPGFIALVSYPASLASKLLFGLAAAQTISSSTQWMQRPVTARQ